MPNYNMLIILLDLNFRGVILLQYLLDYPTETMQQIDTILSQFVLITNIVSQYPRSAHQPMWEYLPVILYTSSVEWW